MDGRKIIILLIFILSLSLIRGAIAQDRIPDLKGKWSGFSFLTADNEGINPSNSHVILTIQKQSGLEFSGTIEIQDKDIPKIRSVSGLLNAHTGYIWYFKVITEGNTLSVGYLITKNVMKVNLRTLNPDSEIAICRLTREKTNVE